jgi:hypothetical protein
MYCKIIGLRTTDFPKDVAAQNVKANAMIHELIVRVLGREEQFGISVRRGSGTQRYARDSNMLLVPPIEVNHNV